jgi:hypothetical protein
MRHSFADANIYSDRNSDRNGHIYSDSDSDGNAYAKPDGNCHSNGDCNGAFANTDSNSHCDSNAYAKPDGNRYRNGECDRTTSADTNSAASTVTYGTALAFFGIRGTRENELASSQPKVGRLLSKAMPN